jgi:methylglutamate dehydrogenase subunit B
MRIFCPYCGARDSAEFQQRGDAKPVRPASSGSIEAFADYTYLRDNPAGRLREFWYHAQGCKSWLIVVRDTRTHEVETAGFAQESGS